MFKLIHLYAENFFSFETLYVDFRRGLTLISGYDESGKDSNGSGKSTILNAIAWGLFSRTLKGVSGQDVVRWGEKNCKVVLTLQSEDHTYEIIRSLTSLDFKIDNIPQKGHKTDLQSVINSAFKTDYYTFCRTTAFSQGQVEFLASAGDAEKKKLFKDILGLSRLDLAYSKIKQEYDRTFRQCESSDGRLELLDNQIRVAESRYSSLLQQGEDWSRIKESKILSLQARKEKEPLDPKLLTQQRSELVKKLQELEFSEADKRNLEAGVTERCIEQEANDREIRRLWEVIGQASSLGKRCEICGSVVNRKMLKHHHSEMEDHIEHLKNRNTEIAAEKERLLFAIAKIDQIVLEREGLKRQVEACERAIAQNILEWEHYQKTCGNLDSQIEELQNSDSPYVQLISNSQKELQGLKDDLSVERDHFSAIRKYLDILTFLKGVLSREGVVGYIIEKEFGRLVTLSNRYLSSIAGGNLYLTIQPQRELKSGALKEEIEIQVFANSRKLPYWGLSDGQRQRINIALLLALNKLCQEHGVNNFDFLLLDEVLDISLAEGGQESVISLLKAYLRDCSTILLISHKDKFKASFHQIIRVYRNADGLSKLI